MACYVIQHDFYIGYIKVEIAREVFFFSSKVFVFFEEMDSCSNSSSKTIIQCSIDCQKQMALLGIKKMGPFRV